MSTEQLKERVRLEAGPSPSKVGPLAEPCTNPDPDRRQRTGAEPSHR